MLSDEKLIEMLVHSISGGIGGGLATACSYPFTNLRIRRIAKDLEKVSSGNDGDSKLIKDEENGSINPIDIIKYTMKIIKKNGVLSLYNGMTSSIIGSVVQYAVYFCSSKFWGNFIDHIKLKPGNITRSIIINLVSAICTALITNPIWVINARMANSEDKKIGNIEMIKQIYKEEGISGFFKGMIPSLILTLVPVMQFTSYEVLKKSFANSNGKISNKNIVVISFISKLMTILVSYPLMTAKALYQSNSKLKSNEIWKLIKLIIKEEGLLGFYKGFGPKVVGSVINNTILMLTYERIQILIKIVLTRFILGNRKFI